jgi:hypothetical protein
MHDIILYLKFTDSNSKGIVQTTINTVGDTLAYIVDDQIFMIK